MSEPLRPAAPVSTAVALLVSIILAFFIPFPWNALVVIGGISVEVVELTWGLRLARRWRPQTGAEAMIGLEAEVVSACRPTGQVRVNGELWEANCAAGADAGATVIVKRLEALTLIVDLTPADAASDRDDIAARSLGFAGPDTSKGGTGKWATSSTLRESMPLWSLTMFSVDVLVVSRADGVRRAPSRALDSSGPKRRPFGEGAALPARARWSRCSASWIGTRRRVEAAIYYCCREGLQNATKHAGPLRPGSLWDRRRQSVCLRTHHPVRMMSG